MRIGTWVSLGFLALGVALGCASSDSSSRFGGGTSSSGSGGAKIGGGGTSAGAGGGIPIGTGQGGDDGDSDAVVPNDDPTNGYITHPECGKGACEDFPSDPIFGEGTSSDTASKFGDASNFDSGSLCVLEPQLSTDSTEGAMFPANWVRPRFRISAPSGYDVFEIRIQNDAQKNTLVAYTKQSTWYMPKDTWAGTPTDAGTAVGAAVNGAGAPFNVTIRAMKSSSSDKPIGVQGKFNVAPVAASGSMVFWTVNSQKVTKDSSKLLGFKVGDEGVQSALTLSDVKWTGQIGEDGAVLRGFYDSPKLADFTNGQVRCIGCHASTPDGDAVVFTDDWPWPKAAAYVSSDNRGSIPSYITSGAQAIMKMPWWGTQSTSKGHWGDSERIVITSYGTTFKQGESRTTAWQALPCYKSSGSCTEDDKVKWHQLAWINLNAEAAATIDTKIYNTSGGDYDQHRDDRNKNAMAAKGTVWGLISTGDTSTSDVSPMMSHKGDKIVYTTTDYSPDGHPDYVATKASIRAVDYNNKAGGTAKKIVEDDHLNYYPTYSGIDTKTGDSDAMIAYTRAPAVSAASPDGPYCNRFGEIWVVKADGSDAPGTRLAANDPVECAGDDTSQGVINSWPKWAPDVVQAHGKTYYFLVFSSARKYGDEFSSQFQLDANSSSDFTGRHDSSQLYLAAMVVDSDGTVTTYPGVYIWNQNRLADTKEGSGIKYSNLTPAWDPFILPDLVIDEVASDVPH